MVVFNISSRHNWINIVHDSFNFSYYRFFNFFFNRGWYLNHFSLGRSTWVANDSQKEATISQSSTYLVLNLWKASGIHKRFNTVKLKLNTWLFTFIEFPIFRVAFNYFKRSHLNSIVFIKEPVQEVSSMDWSYEKVEHKNFA